MYSDLHQGNYCSVPVTTTSPDKTQINETCTVFDPLSHCVPVPSFALWISMGMPLCFMYKAWYLHRLHRPQAAGAARGSRTSQHRRSSRAAGAAACTRLSQLPRIVGSRMGMRFFIPIIAVPPRTPPGCWCIRGSAGDLPNVPGERPARGNRGFPTHARRDTLYRLLGRKPSRARAPRPKNTSSRESPHGHARDPNRNPNLSR